MIFKQLSTLCLAAALTACASAPTHLIVAPDVNTNAASTYQNKQASLTVMDMRTSNHIIQILKEGDAATILSSQERLESIIEHSLLKNWQKQGLEFHGLANNQIHITIEKAIISVEQATVSYKSQHEIIIKVSINNGTQTLTNTFKSRGNSEGALTADIAVLEREFNQSLSTLLLQILNSSDIKSFI